MQLSPPSSQEPIVPYKAELRYLVCPGDSYPQPLWTVCVWSVRFGYFRYIQPGVIRGPYEMMLIKWGQWCAKEMFIYTWPQVHFSTTPLPLLKATMVLRDYAWFNAGDHTWYQESKSGSVTSKRSTLRCFGVTSISAQGTSSLVGLGDQMRVSHCTASALTLYSLWSKC